MQIMLYNIHYCHVDDFKHSQRLNVNVNWLETESDSCTISPIYDAVVIK